MRALISLISNPAAPQQHKKRDPSLRPLSAINNGNFKLIGRLLVNSTRSKIRIWELQSLIGTMAEDTRPIETGRMKWSKINARTDVSTSNNIVDRNCYVSYDYCIFYCGVCKNVPTKRGRCKKCYILIFAVCKFNFDI